ncbi:hypothetical protein S101446_03400 (plasmid) [Komagataeibacter europaeus]|nr:hypothetical protein S101446_03400 [Komagataeibacter europaeus]
MTEMDSQARGNRFITRMTGGKIRGRQGQKVSPLYRWMMENFEDISEARQTTRAWDIFIEIAHEDGITGTVENTEITRKTAAKTWARVRRAHVGRPHDIVRQSQKQLLPSRQSKDWKPDIIDGKHESLPLAAAAVPAEIASPQKKPSQVASLPTTILKASVADLDEEEIRRRGRARAEEIIRDLENRRRLQEPGFHRE